MKSAMADKDYDYEEYVKALKLTDELFHKCEEEDINGLNCLLAVLTRSLHALYRWDDQERIDMIHATALKDATDAVVDEHIKSA